MYFEYYFILTEKYKITMTHMTQCSTPEFADFAK